MIYVNTGDDDDREFDTATRYSTDEHNNLEIWCGEQGDKLVAVFAAGVWREVGVDET